MIEIDPTWQAQGLASLVFFSAVGWWLRNAIARSDARKGRRR